MRKVLMLSGMALALASFGAASAQQPSTAATPSSTPAGAAKAQAPAGPLTILNLGYRGSWVDGDEARWERYQDLRDGILVGGSFASNTDQSAYELKAANVGYHDQQYTADYNKFGKLKFSAQWNSIPLNYAYNTFTPWQDAGDNKWTLDAATRTRVQNKEPGVLGIGTSAAQYNLPSIYRGIAMANPFAMQSRRDIIDLGVKYQVNDAIGIDIGLNSAKRGGNQPFGASFAFNNGNELPMSVDDRTTDLTAGLQWAKAGSMVRFQWLGSKYKNEFLSLTWDNPLRATDFSNGKTPPAGPYDPSGYSNGNGPAFGELALAPGNSMNSFTLIGLHKLPGRSTLSGQVAYTSMKQDEALLPWSTNSAINNAAVWAAFPHLQHLPRETAQGDISVMNAVLNFTTRPSNVLAFDARLRYNKRDNKTPVFDATEYVRFDAVPEETGITAGHDVTRTTFEAGATYSALHNSAVRLSYIMDDAARTGRVYGGLRDNTVRLSFDTYGNQFYTVRLSGDLTSRSGRNFSLEALEESSSQEALRFYDEAPLSRKVGSANLQLNPSDKFDVGFIVAATKDEFDDKEQEFGLLDNSNTSYNVSVNWYPLKQATLGGSFGYDKYHALQESRNANPLGGTAYESWTDPNRNWALDNDETVKNLGLYLDLPKAFANTDIRVNYDLSSSDNGFQFSGPRIQELSTNVALTPGDGSPCGAGIVSCFKPFKPVTSTWNRLQADVTHMFGAKYGVSAGYAFDKLEIQDFATTDLLDGTPRIDPLGEISTGYGNRPYTGHTLSVRFIYMFQLSKPVL